MDISMAMSRVFSITSAIRAVTMENEATTTIKASTTNMAIFSSFQSGKEVEVHLHPVAAATCPPCPGAARRAIILFTTGRGVNVCRRHPSRPLIMPEVTQQVAGRVKA